MSIEENKEKVRKFFHYLCTGDVPGFVNMYHPDGAVWTSGQTLISGTFGKEQISRAAGAIYEAFPQGLNFTILAMTAEGDRVAVEAKSEGDHISGKRYENLYHFLFEFRDGQLYRLKEYMDTEKVTDILCGGQRPGQGS